ncbi:MAG: trypsin-like peptidase domain-containing protein [Clostridia bacterium]|nr:trypsin-like peptidase domain-containing protein [Clostridia bacterium]
MNHNNSDDLIPPSPEFFSELDEDLDLELIEHLNAIYGDNEVISDPSPQEKAPKAVKITALITSLVFILFLLGSWLEFFTWPLPRQEQQALKELGINNLELKELKQAVVAVESWSSSGIPDISKAGTGFNISPHGLVLTNKHVVNGASHVRIRFPGGKTYNSLHCKTSKTADLAVIKINPKVLSHKLPYLKFAEKNPPPGEKIFIIGNPHRLDRVTETGEVVGYFKLSGSDQTVMVIAAAVEPGSSGSPVFDTSGRIVGIVYASLSNMKEKTENKPLGLAVPLSHINEFLENNKET